MLEEFLESYAEAFSSFSPSKIGEYYQFPAIFHTENGDLVTFTQEEFISNNKNLLNNYQSIGIKKISYEVQHQTKVSNAITLVSVLWHFKSTDNDIIYSAKTSYLLKQASNTFKIASVIMVNEYTEFSKVVNKKT